MIRDFSHLSDRALSQLIAAAHQEWARRQQPTQSEAAQPPPAASPTSPAEPPEADKAFVLSVKTMVGEGCYIKAAERHRVAEIAEHFPDWVARQGLPCDAGTGSWRRAGEILHRYPPAKER